MTVEALSACMSAPAVTVARQVLVVPSGFVEQIFEAAMRARMTGRKEPNR